MISSGLPSWRSNLIEISPSLVESCRFACLFSVQDWWKKRISRLTLLIFDSLILELGCGAHGLGRVAG